MPALIGPIGTVVNLNQAVMAMQWATLPMHHKST